MGFCARPKGMCHAEFKTGGMPLNNFSKLPLKELLVLCDLCFLFFQWDGRTTFDVTQWRLHLVIIRMSIIVTEIAKSCQHCVRTEAWWQMAINISSLYTIRELQQVLVHQVLDAIFPISDWSFLTINNNALAGWRSWHIIPQEEFWEFLKNSWTYTLSLDLNLDGGVPPRPKRITWTFPAVTVFGEQPNHSCRNR